jgi:hypothetical protein
MAHYFRQLGIFKDLSVHDSKKETITTKPKRPMNMEGTSESSKHFMCYFYNIGVKTFFFGKLRKIFSPKKAQVENSIILK